MPITTFLSKQDETRKEILHDLHQVIISGDATIVAEIGMMMGKEMIIYKSSGVFKYALGNGKQHMSLHLMPIYCSPTLHEKYKKLLSNAAFQKGCINFKSAEEMPLKIVQSLIGDCAKVDIRAILEEYKNKKK